MENGIIINGVEYELVADFDNKYSDGFICFKCALKDLCAELSYNVLCYSIFEVAKGHSSYFKLK